MSFEKERIKHDIWRRITEFIEQGLRTDTMSSFIFEGPIDVPTHYHTFVGIFPQTKPRQESSFAIVSDVPTSSAELYQKILSLRMTERLKEISRTIITDPNVVTFLELQSAFLGYPSIVLGRGTTLQTNEEVTALFTVAGRTPSETLQLLQERTKARISKLG